MIRGELVHHIPEPAVVKLRGAGLREPRPGSGLHKEIRPGREPAWAETFCVRCEGLASALMG